MIDTKAIRAAAQADMECPIEAWEVSISQIQSATVIALLDRLEAAEAENKKLQEKLESALKVKNFSEWGGL